ncbi:MAG: EAL domain-containing protein [Gammaproteobacteria bacterium]|nr:EAL domain-containing protein [Gammaproteobacteria bacterium]
MEKLNVNGYRVQFSVLLLASILIIVISNLVYIRSVQTDFIETNLKVQAEVISGLISEDLAKIIFLEDPDIIASISYTLKAIKELHSAKFFDIDNKLVIKISADDKDAIAKDFLRIKTTIMFDGVHVGYAYINLFSEQLEAAKNKNQIYYRLFLFLLLIVTTFIVFIIDKKFISRIAELNFGLEVIAKERDFSKRLTVDSNDEIGQAKRHFNHLAQMVEEQTLDLTYQANHDALTALYNRNRLLELLEALLQNRPQNGFHAVCYLDLDQFKVVNDTCGHTVGDDLLCLISSQFLKVIESFEGATIGRIGGDEFIVLIDNQSKGKIHSVIHEIQTMTNEFRFKFLEREFEIGVSIGCILFSNEQTTSAELLSASDALCYQVKKMNRGDTLIRYLDDKQLLDYQKSMNWVSRINSSLEKDLFKIYLQPIVSTKKVNSTWNHFEVLIRLQENKKIISPIHFIPAAERYGLSKKIDAWVINEVFSQLSINPDFTNSLELISINLSVLSIVDKKFQKQVEALFDQYHIPTSKICFEITETGVISSIEEAIDFIRHFRELGVSFSLDDFGSGMSSFGYLRELEVDIIKIDGQFVKNITHDAVMREMVEAMIKIGHVTENSIVAEHVEDQKTVEMLKEMNADFIQGYFYSKPLPFEEFL